MYDRNSREEEEEEKFPVDIVEILDRVERSW
jgi:hypothetical protein